MRRFFAVLSIVLATPMLGACFHSLTPHITAENAAFPYEEISYHDSENEVWTLTREGDVYIDKSDETSPKMRFMELRDGIWLAQAEFPEEVGGPFFAYSVIRADFATLDAAAYASTAEKAGLTKDNMAERGFSACEHLADAACFDDIQTYIDFALAQIDAGEEPEETFTLVAPE